MEWKGKVWPYLLAWTVLNLIQASFTELFHDEAHYWMFSQNLQWGYWDHPPATPFLIFLGSSLLPGELGARLFIVLASTATVFFLYRLVRPKNLPLFFSLIFSVLLIHIGGFMAAPDIALVFFASAFLLAYRSYLENDSLKGALLLAFLTACLAYSKYHGAIFLLFLFLPNWKLVKRPTFWAIPLIALLLFIPHLLWQFNMDFPTFRYHLIDRGAEPHEWRFVGDYIGGQLLVFGPLMAFVILIAAFRRKPEDLFEKSLKWCFVGILVFFFYRSFQERTEANWTATALFPAIYLCYQFIKSRPNWHKWVYRLMVPSILIVLVFRVYLMWDFLPEKMNPRNEFHNWDSWAADIAEVAGSTPVIFYNSYRNPSKYQFYAGEKAHTLSVWSHSGNQYALLFDQELALQGKDAMIMSSYIKMDTPFIPGAQSEYGYQEVKDFRSYNYLRIKILDPIEQAAPNSVHEMDIELINPTDSVVDFSESSRTVFLSSHVYDGERVVINKPALSQSLKEIKLAPGETIQLKAKLTLPEETGNFRYRFTIHVENLHNGRQANFYNIVVE